MSIWEYSDHVCDKELIIDGLSLQHCVFCGTNMVRLHGKARTHGKRQDSHYSREQLNIKTCNTCGWWTAEETHNIRNKRGRCSHIPKVGYRSYGSVALLRNLELSDVSVPIQEIRDFLTAKYDHRYGVHPRLFEETVASVFHDLGFRTKVTAYSGDGGIDVVLDGSDNTEIGIQVKRYRDSISVEQIRSFTGALLLGGYTNGIFVTTSRFQSGCSNTARLAMLRGMRIDLVDAQRFYDALRIAQRNVYRSKEELLEQLKTLPLTLLRQGGKW